MFCTCFTLTSFADEFAEFCHTRWPLKPLFFEVPQRDPHPAFIGRQWLFAEILELLSSDLPTNRGVTIMGAAGTGKTAIALKLVERSCFGRGDLDTQGKLEKGIDITDFVTSRFRIFSFSSFSCAR